MQQQLHSLNEWIGQHPEESNERLCASITIDATNPVRRHLPDDHPPTITIVELKAVLGKAICRDRDLHKRWEVKKGLVQQRVSVATESWETRNVVFG